MILQNIVFRPENKDAAELYYKANNELQVEQLVRIKNGTKVDLRSYFNIFSAEKWKKYTQIHSIFAAFEMQGTAVLSIYHMKEQKGKLKKSLLKKEILSSAVMQVLRTEELQLPDEGVIGIALEAQSDLTIAGAYFGTENAVKVREVFLGIGICTFKREIFVERNMNQLKAGILENEKALSHAHVSVCISDNAGTLDHEKIASDDVRIVQNKNLGGVGGFTRTMFEHQKTGRATHVLLMDDDAIISIEAVERTYTFLTVMKKEYQDYVIGGSLVRSDFPTIQHELGALWNAGNVYSFGHNYDLSRLKNVLANEKVETVEYTGWWYSCIPVTFIQNENYPLPLFIHMDDVEYGIRAKGKILYLNGVCAWHESFDNKHSGALQYYDIRNLAIVNAIHCEDYGKKQFKRRFLYVAIRNIVTYRYKYLDLNIRGALDFMRGSQWFHDLDTLELHQSLSQYGYKPEQTDLLETDSPYGELVDYKMSIPKKVFCALTLNGHLLPAKKGKYKVLKPEANMFEAYRCEDVYYIDNSGKTIHVRKDRKEFLSACRKLWKAMRRIDKGYDRAVLDYRNNYQKLTTEEFWKHYLEID